MAALLAIGLSGLVALEFGVRTLAPQSPRWLDIYQRHPRLPFHSLQPDRHVRIDSKEQRWEVWTDADGFRCPPAPRADPRPIVLWIGDSFTFGHGVDFEQSFVGRIAGRPDARRRHVNAAVGGHGPVQYRALLEDLLLRLPEVRLVVVGVFVGNDFHDTVWEKDVPVRDGVIGDDGGARIWVKRNLHSYRLAARLFRSLHEREESADPMDSLLREELWEEPLLLEASRRFREAFEGIAQSCSAREIPVAVLVLPTLGMVRAARSQAAEQAPAAPGHRIAVDRALALLQGLDLLVIDCTAALAAHPPDSVYFPLDQHLTPAGHAVIQELLEQHLQAAF